MARKYFFNLPQPIVLTDAGETTLFYSSDPAIVLEEEEHRLGARNATQQAAIDAINREPPLEDSPMFGSPLDWAYRKYKVYTLSGQDGGKNLSLGDRPAQPISARAFQPAAPATPSALSPVLYLFNVIVALEWLPTRETLNQLEWAFRRASDNLYDVSNGCMAFGQVIFADVSWMRCADIQIMASNRFLPRSWVSGLLDPEKYTPIRVGRGVWVRDRQVEVPWDEPEGYRALIHEWGHYALGLKDEYISALNVVNDRGVLKAAKAGVGDPQAKDAAQIVVPLRRIAGESIMATIQGNSEIEPLSVEPSFIDVGGMQIDQYFPSLRERLAEPQEGPGRMPLPLPAFRYVGPIGDEAQQNEQVVKLPFLPRGQAPNQAETSAFIPRDTDGSPDEGWMLYLIRGDLRNPTQIIPQGEVDSRAPTEGFTLLGAAEQDNVVLIGLHDGQTTVRTGKLRVTNDQKDEIDWDAGAAQNIAAARQPVPPDFQNVDVLPAPTNEKKGSAPAKVRLANDEGAIARAAPKIPPKILGDDEGAPVVFSLYGKREGPNRAGTIELPSLDGYVLTGKPGSYMISDFSKGGPPNSAPNVVSDFLAAGAASGDAVLFFAEPGDPPNVPAEKFAEKYKDIHVVVTTLRGVKLPAGYKAVSSVFSIASTAPLPEDTHPTLLIVSPMRGDTDTSRLRICRLGDDVADQLPTFFSNGAAFAAASLIGSLTERTQTVNDPNPAPRAERYVLAEVPDASPGQS